MSVVLLFKFKDYRRSIRIVGGVDDCTRLIDELPDVILEAGRDRYDAESRDHHNMTRRAKKCRCLRVKTKPLVPC